MFIILAMFALGLRLGLGAALDVAAGRVVEPRQVAIPSNVNFIRREGCQVAVLGNYVYIDGGEVSELVNGALTSPPSFVINETLSISLAVPWTNATVPINSIQKPAPAMDTPTLWISSSSNSFYEWGGQSPYGAQLPADELWKFTANSRGGGVWSAEAPTNTILLRTVNGGFTQSQDTGFLLGGLLYGWTDPRSPTSGYTGVPGLLSFNMVTKEWKTESAAAFTPSGTYTDGTLCFLPAFGAQGVLVPLGGIIPGPILSTDPISSTDPAALEYLDFTNISIYDIASGQWYWQAASGVPPGPRLAPCSVGVQEVGSGSYEIFVFGGYNELNNQTYDEVYVLSLPGFVWSQANYSPQAPRIRPACAVIGNRQMLSVGGYPIGPPQPWYVTDPWPQGIGVFDMTDMTWSSSYDPNAALYRQPQVVSAWYKNGGSAAWSSDGVKDFFTGPKANNSSPSATLSTAILSTATLSTAKLSTATISTATPSTTTPSTATPLTASQASTPVGAIAGGVIGGLALLALIALVIHFIILRKKNRPDSNHAANKAGPKRHELPMREDHYAQQHVNQAPVALPAS